MILASWPAKVRQDSGRNERIFQRLRLLPNLEELALVMDEREAIRDLLSQRLPKLERPAIN